MIPVNACVKVCVEKHLLVLLIHIRNIRGGVALAYDPLLGSFRLALENLEHSLGPYSFLLVLTLRKGAVRRSEKDWGLLWSFFFL